MFYFFFSPRDSSTVQKNFDIYVRYQVRKYVVILLRLYTGGNKYNDKNKHNERSEERGPIFTNFERSLEPYDVWAWCNI